MKNTARRIPEIEKRLHNLQLEKEHFTAYYERCPAICGPRLQSIEKNITYLKDKLGNTI